MYCDVYSMQRSQRILVENVLETGHLLYLRPSGLRREEREEGREGQVLSVLVWRVYKQRRESGEIFATCLKKVTSPSQL